MKRRAHSAAFGGLDVASACALSTPPLVMRPSLPEPLMVDGSIPLSSRSLRTAGEYEELELDDLEGD